MASACVTVALSFALVVVSLQGCSEIVDPDTGVPSPCGYNFTKPTCDMAGVQAPRDVSNSAVGLKPAAFSPLSDAQRSKLTLTNIHFHLGAEHYSEGEYMHMHVADGHRRLAAQAHAVRAGFMCNATEHANALPYNFKFCRNVEVGKTYEIHSVWSSAGYDPDQLTDGLGQAANGRNLLNPFIVVQAQVFVIVNDDKYSMNNMTNGWDAGLAKSNAVSYAGSTTGTSHNNNDICSPYAVSWHVDRACHPIHAASFDNMCRMLMQDHNVHNDVEPHGSRELVDAKYVVPWNEVTEPWH